MPQNWTPQSYDYSQWNDDKYRAAAEAAAREVGVDPDFLFRIGKFGEGGGTFNPRINPDSGARGPWQAIPSTYRKMGYTDQQADDPNISARIGARVLSDMQARFGGDDNWALAGYSGHQSDIQAGKLGPDALAYISRVKGGQPVTAGDVGMKPGQLHDTLSSMPELMRMWQAAASALQQENTAWQQDVQKRGQRAGQRRDQMFGQIQEQINQPAPENDPKAELFTRLAGGLSQALAPRLNGQQQAQDVMGQRLSAIREQRMQSLSMLVRQYQQAAQEASSLGDRAAELKHLNKAASLGKELEGLAGVMKTVGAAEAKAKGGGKGSGEGKYKNPRSALYAKHIEKLDEKLLSLDDLSMKEGDKKKAAGLRERLEVDRAFAMDAINALESDKPLPDRRTWTKQRYEQLRKPGMDDYSLIQHLLSGSPDGTVDGMTADELMALYDNPAAPPPVLGPAAMGGMLALRGNVRSQHGERPGDLMYGPSGTPVRPQSPWGPVPAPGGRPVPQQSNSWWDLPVDEAASQLMNTTWPNIPGEPNFYDRFKYPPGMRR